MNIRLSKDKWKGLAPEQHDPAFFQFSAAVYGIRAAVVILRNYQKKYGLNTVSSIINRWAPGLENDTDAYIRAVASDMKVGAEQPLDLSDHVTLRALVSAIIHHENGMQPYPDNVLDEAIAMAGA